MNPVAIVGDIHYTTTSLPSAHQCEFTELHDRYQRARNFSQYHYRTNGDIHHEGLRSQFDTFHFVSSGNTENAEVSEILVFLLRTLKCDILILSTF